MKRTLELPYAEKELLSIRKGDEVYLSGIIYVGRDMVHKKLEEAISLSLPLPFEFEHNGIYYMGPSPAKNNHVFGAAGPTTSARMDPFSPLLISKGLRLMIGKGPRDRSVQNAIKNYKGVYLQAIGGCGALYASKIDKSEVVAYSSLGPEALLRITVHDFPTLCIIDSDGEIL